MKQEERNFEGILFTLKKRLQSPKRNDQEYYKYLALGYYDGIDINIANAWYKLRPKGLDEYKLQVNLDDPYIDQYTIRAVIPENWMEMEKEGFCYSFWRKIAESSIVNLEKCAVNSDKKYPFITMSVINLSENYVKAAKDLTDMQDGVARILKESINISGGSLQEMHSVIFPSIGYSDFIILFLTDNLKSAANVINYLRGATTQDKSAVVSNCYSVCGLDKRFFEEGYADDVNADIQMTTRINLKEGLSPSGFLHELEGELEDRIKKAQGNSELKKMKAELTKAYYTTFGNSDCLILPEERTGQYLRLHGPGQLFDPSEDFFRNHIISVRTSIRVEESEGIYSQRKKNVLDRDMKYYKELFESFIQKCEPVLQKNDMHIRGLKAIQKIMKNFLNVAQVSHGFDVEHVIGRAFQSLIEGAEKYIDEPFISFPEDGTEEKGKEVQKLNEEVKERKWLAMDAVEIFKEYIGVLLADMARSDRPFIEGNTLTHPAIGSATKLLFAYCAILEKLLEKFKASDEFTFVVVSGGCDRTEAIDLFSFAREADNLNKLILIWVPEMSLYDIQGTLFRMLHECMHFVGDRKRVERHDCLIRAIAGAIAGEIVEYEFGKESLEPIQKSASGYMSSSNKEKINAFIEMKYQEAREKVKEEITNAFAEQNLFSDFRKNHKKEQDYHANILNKKYLDEGNLVRLFQTETDQAGEKGTFFEKVYEILEDAQAKLVCSIYKELETMYKDSKGKDSSEISQIRQSLSALLMLYENYEYMSRHPEEKDLKLEQFIRKYFSSLVGNVPLTSGEQIFRAKFSFPSLFLEVYDAMKESFSDCASIQILKMKEEDFILSFIYELWDIDVAFPVNIRNILRLGTDFKVNYGITGGLPQNTIEAIRAKVELRKGQGYEYKNIDKMLGQIDIILNEYSKDWCSGIRKEMEKYLSVCMNGGEDWYSEELGSLYQLCDFKLPQNVYRVLDRLIVQWKDLGGV